MDPCGKPAVVLNGERINRYFAEALLYDNKYSMVFGHNMISLKIIIYISEERFYTFNFLSK